LIQPPQPGNDLPEGDIHIDRAENYTSWTFEHNIIYNQHGIPLLFGIEQTSFSQ
jgi:hypothetical protein